MPAKPRPLEITDVPLPPPGRGSNGLQFLFNVETMKTKLSIIREHMTAGRWREAIRVAARFPQLGEHRGAILDAQLAYTNPEFCRGIRKDPDAMIRAGIEALRARYS